MEYTKEQYLADLQELKSKLEADFEAKSTQKTAELEQKHAQQIEELKQAIEDAKNIKPEVTAEELKSFKEQHELDIRAIEKSFARVKGIQLPAEQKAKSFNERLAEAVEEKHDDVQKFIKGESKRLNIELKAVGAVSTGNVTGTTNYGAGNDGKFVVNPNNIGHIRSLIPTRPYGPATDYYFMRENGAGEGSIAATAETTAAAAATTQATGLKPQFDVDLVEDSVKFEWIAGWMLMSRKAMQNIPGFLGFLQSRLPERLLDAEDAQILYGNGTSPNLDGILNTGNFVASTSTISNALITKIIDDITLLEDTHKRIANGILLRPSQWASLVTNTASGSGEYDLPPGVTFINGQLSIFGIPVAKTTALTGTDYVVGDFVNGTELLIQEAMNIQFFEQDSTNVRTNQVTVRIEEAIALPVYGSNFFVKGTSATA